MCDWEVDVQLASGGSQSAYIEKVKLLLEHDDDTVLIHEESNDGRRKRDCFVCPAAYLENGQSPCIAVAVTNIRNLNDDISIMKLGDTEIHTMLDEKNGCMILAGRELSMITGSKGSQRKIANPVVVPTTTDL